LTQSLVSIVRCAPRSEARNIQAAVGRALEDLGAVPDTLGAARRVLVKVNVSGNDPRWHLGHPVSVVDPRVVAGALAWLRRINPACEILVADGQHHAPMAVRYAELGYPEAVAPYGARLVDANTAPFVRFPTPGGGLMFSHYTLSAQLAGVDAVISVAKMKAHGATGATLTLKNLFGLSPNDVYGAPLRYLHAPVRLPRVLVDLASVLRPCLGVVDAIVGAEGHEWGGPPVTPGLILAGTNIVATDTVAMHLMGLDPLGDYPTHPYTFDANPIRLAAEIGLGPNRLGEISVRYDGDWRSLTTPFSVDDRRDAALVAQVRRSTAEAAVGYGARREHYLDRYMDQCILLAGEEVLGAIPSLQELSSRTALARRAGRPGQGVFIKKVTVEEPERLEVYARVLTTEANA